MNSTFNEDECLHKIKHYLPAQATLKDFVHHNSLHAFQNDEFFKAIFSASKIFGFRVTLDVNTYRQLHEQGRIRPEIIDQVISRSKGEKRLCEYWEKMLYENYRQTYNPRVGRFRAQWKSVYHIDLDNLVHPLLFRILGSYLDQGIALWHFPFEDTGLINAVRQIEEKSFASFFRSKRARSLLMDHSTSIEKLLEIIVGQSGYFENYLFDQQFAHKGWSGIFGVIEDHSNYIFYKKKIALKDLILLELLLEIDALDYTLGQNWDPLSTKMVDKPIDYLSGVQLGEQEEVLQLWQEAFEWSYYDQVLSAVNSRAKKQRVADNTASSFQAVFCIDDREGSIRRHLESTDRNCQTFGAPGHFGVAAYFQPYGAKFFDKICPVPVTPKHLIKELDKRKQKKREPFHSQKTHSFWSSFFSTVSLGLLAGYRLLADLLHPKKQPYSTDSYSYMNVEGTLQVEADQLEQRVDGLQVGYTPEEMTQVVYSELNGIGLTKDFAPLVYIIGHGSSSANNPHHGAYECGACSGRPGSVNARVFAYMSNHPEVRRALIAKGVTIPEETQFVAGIHDTANDEFTFYDLHGLSRANLEHHQNNVTTIERALDLNALERAGRFASIDTRKGSKYARKAIKKRSVSYFEPRPELGHGTNALCYVGSRERIKGLFLDRRAFLQSYDYREDPDGTILQKVLAPLPGVCGGINLEYYFSRMDVEKMGAGSKLPHNVTGLVAVVNSSDGDLRSGLPMQMTETHDPIRMMMIVESDPATVLKVISSDRDTYGWFDNEWIHLVVISPIDWNLYHFRNGQFESYEPISEVIHTVDIIKVLEGRNKMPTSHILDATKENIPVHIDLAHD